MKHFTMADFDDNGVIQHDGLILVDFYANWCGPCKMLAPVLEEVEKEFDDVTIAKVNVDEEPVVAALFKIISIPAIYLIKDREVVAKRIGYHSAEQLIDLINEYR